VSKTRSFTRKPLVTSQDHKEAVLKVLYEERSLSGYVTIILRGLLIRTGIDEINRLVEVLEEIKSAGEVAFLRVDHEKEVVHVRLHSKKPKI